MPSLREIHRKIKSVKSTEQITKAMKMVAAARMRKSQQAILAARPFASRMEQLAKDLAAIEAGARAEGLAESSAVHSFFEKRTGGPAALILVTADKGLCGAFNSNLIRAAIGWLKARAGRKVYVAAVGRKGRDFLHRLRGHDLEFLTELAGIFPKVQFSHAELLGRAVIEAYETKGLASVTLIYNEFKSVASQNLVETTLLPIPSPQGKSVDETAIAEYGFEPPRPQLLAALLPRFVKAQLYRVLLESQAAELAARMNAMDAASNNANELRQSLNLGLNRKRQAIITREIAELVGGAEALAS
ncbi:MAG: ATP synthase F1 subunit gamma [Elusimicrobia bacterium]|nr:ATP synthase F1 subunit gamma [Elusimicrobiota bacterium]MDE2426733.1 ATP synthase F1 subunit gamma [Elusimicrobiota bacterium]